MMLFAVTAHAQTTKLTGKIANWKAGSDNHLTNIAGVGVALKITEDGSFKVNIPKLPKGVYNLPGIGHIYLEPGYSLLITPNKDKKGYQFSGKGSLENTLRLSIRSQFKDYFPMNGDNFLFKTYMMDVAVFLNKMNSYKTNIHRQLAKSPSVFFKELAKKELDLYCQHYLHYYRLYYGVDSVKQKEFYKVAASKTATTEARTLAQKAARLKVLSNEHKTLLDSLSLENQGMNDSVLFVNSALYRYVMTNKILSDMFTDYSADLSAGKIQAYLKLKVAQKNISNKFISDYYTYTFTSDVIEMSRDSVLKDSVFKAFITKPYRADYKAKIAEIYNSYMSVTANHPAPDFIYADADGQKISLSSLRGKYVYIDVWATWCGPCQKEIPYLSEIEEEYKDRKIQFISLSVDAAKDTGKWKEFVKANHLKGIQLIADKDFNSDFIKKFNINNIPRFILINPEGIIVSADAKRPSDPELKTMFNKLPGL